MTYKKINIIEKIKNIHTIDDTVTASLYRQSIGSLLILLVLTVGVALYLYPLFPDTIFIWTVIIFTFMIFRLYCAYLYVKNEEKYSTEQWYAKFALFAYTTAFLFSSLSFLFLPYLDAYRQLFIITVIIGVTSGSTISLSSDFRLVIGYMGILLLPLIVTLLITGCTPFSTTLVMALLLYYLAHIIMIIKKYRYELEFKKLQSEQLFLRRLFDEAPIGIFSYDMNMKIVDCNHKFGNLFGYERSSIIGMDVKNLPDTRPLHIFKTCLHNGPQAYTGPYVSLKKKQFYINIMAFPFSNGNDKTVGGVGIIEDKTQEHNALKELQYLVKHDALTGLLNRRGFTSYMDHLVLNQKHTEYYSILFYIDLNQFKSINDSLGHTIGDDVLLAVSKRLLNVLPEHCVVSRLGGDEFIVIIPYVAMEQSIVEQKSKKYSKILEKIFSNPFSIKDMLLHVKASIGIVIIEPGYKNIEEIIRHADITMYHAKKSNNYISYYNESLDKKQKELFSLQYDLAYATYNDELELFLQPIVRMSDDTALSAELLLRWQHPVKGLLSPNAFIPLALEAGLLSQITWWVVDELCSCIEKWKRKGIWNLKYISININAKQLVENNFAATFLKKLKAYNVDTEDIMIEITERSLIDNFDSTQAVISHLRAEGVRCAIDDFGIGYSSLSYLKKLSFNTLKIDREFVKNIETRPQDLRLMKTILDIGRQFNYNIVIEGIEQEEQKELLHKLDPKLSYQGYLFSRPLKAEKFAEKYLKK